MAQTRAVADLGVAAAPGDLDHDDVQRNRPPRVPAVFVHAPPAKLLVGRRRADPAQSLRDAVFMDRPDDPDPLQLVPRIDRRLGRRKVLDDVERQHRDEHLPVGGEDVRPTVAIARGSHSPVVRARPAHDLADAVLRARYERHRRRVAYRPTPVPKLRSIDVLHRASVRLTQLRVLPPAGSQAVRHRGRVGDGGIGFEQARCSECNERAPGQRQADGIGRRGAVSEGSKLRVGADEDAEALARDQAPAIR